MNALELHQKAAELREAGQSLEALHYHSDALVQAGIENDPARMAEILADRSIVYRHLAAEQGSSLLLHLAKGDLENAIAISTHLSDEGATALPIHSLGKVMQELGDYKAAIDLYTQAIELFKTTPPSEHNRPGVIADMKIDLATTEYMHGDKSARSRAEEAIEELKTSGENTVSMHNYNVWLSGAYMRMAYILKTDDLNSAKDYLAKAKEIIEANSEDLSIRMKQFQKLEASFNE